MITEMFNQMVSELTAALDTINVFPLLVLIGGMTIFYVGYAYIVNSDN